MKPCVECGKSFAPWRYDQKFCSPACRERFKKRKQRLRRQGEGLCPQCGKPLIERPFRKTHDKARQRITYCRECRNKFAERHKALVESR